MSLQLTCDLLQRNYLGTSKIVSSHHGFSQVTDDGVASLQAEQGVLSCARTAVLRVPRCLYGFVEDLQESPVTGGVLEGFLWENFGIIW